MEAVKARRMNITAAATTFSVPRKTLDDRVKGLVIHGKKSGVSTVLTAKEEASLISQLSSLHGKARLSADKDNGEGFCVGYCKTLW